MPKQRIWTSLTSFDLNPKKTFFGLDKHKAHCFTLPKVVNEEYTDYFNLTESSLQSKILIEINSHQYPAIVRMARLDRSKTYKLKPKELPSREILQFQWVKYKETQTAVREYLEEAYNAVKSGGKTDLRVKFYHMELDIFLLRADH
jgi:hypothetical protein